MAKYSGAEVPCSTCIYSLRLYYLPDLHECIVNPQPLFRSDSLYSLAISGYQREHQGFPTGHCRKTEHVVDSLRPQLCQEPSRISPKNNLHEHYRLAFNNAQKMTGSCSPLQGRGKAMQDLERFKSILDWYGSWDNIDKWLGTLVLHGSAPRGS